MKTTQKIQKQGNSSYSNNYELGTRDSLVGIALGYWLKARGSVPGTGKKITTLQRPDHFWGSVSLLSSGYLGLFPRG
jgi:hypothetical protein